MAAVHDNADAGLLPPSVFNKSSTLSSVAASVASGLSTLSIAAPASSASIHQTRLVPSGVHALTILARAMKDPILSPPSEDHHGVPDELRGDDGSAKAKRERVAELAEQWAAGIDLTRPGVLDAKMEELAWFAGLIYGVGGWSKDKPFWADFFT
jgi:hypothetical protein